MEQYNTMEPNKKIPSFCFESPWLKTWTSRYPAIRVTWAPEQGQDLSAYHNFDVEAELTALLSAEIDREILRDLVTVQPLDLPSGRLLYLDYVYGEPKDPTVYDDGSWSMGNTFEGVIGIKSEIKPHTFI